MTCLLANKSGPEPAEPCTSACPGGDCANCVGFDQRRTLAPCMGGGCLERETCGHYHAAMRVRPSERLCRDGRDYFTLFRPLPTTTT